MASKGGLLLKMVASRVCDNESEDIQRDMLSELTKSNESSREVRSVKNGFSDLTKVQIGQD